MKCLLDESRFDADPEGLELADRISSFLPDEIRVFSVQRVNDGFFARKACKNRTYTYFVPVYLLTGSQVRLFSRSFGIWFRIWMNLSVWWDLEKLWVCSVEDILSIITPKENSILKMKTPGAAGRGGGSKIQNKSLKRTMMTLNRNQTSSIHLPMAVLEKNMKSVCNLRSFPRSCS